MTKTGKRKVDAHMHFWKLARGDYDWMTPDLTALYRDFTPDDIGPDLAKAAITDVIAVQAAATVAETEFLLTLADRHSFIAGVIGWADMDSHSFVDECDRLSEHPKFKGIRPMIQEIADPDWMLGERPQSAFSFIEKRGLCFEFLIHPHHLDQTHQTLIRYPSLRAIVNHGAKPPIAAGEFDHWANGMRRIASETNALCKLSGLLTEAKHGAGDQDLRRYVDWLLENFGPERLAFGSDWPVLKTVGEYAAWLAMANRLLADLSDDQRDAIFGGNAVDFYRL